MDFNSPVFLFLFLPIFMLIYYLSPLRIKIFAGIAGGVLFYSFGNPDYVYLILGLGLIAYGIGRGIEAFRGRAPSLLFLWGGIVINVFLIIGFKLWSNGPYLLGLSFLTFQVISYFVEVYNKKIEAEKNLLYFLFYILLFPKIPVGPITRYSELRDQIRTIRIEPQDVADGIRRFIRGFAKKVLIADTLGKVVSPVFNLTSPTVSPEIAWLVLISFALQLYFDFSGYCDMAIGLGKMMGFKFIENFNFPYVSKSISEFWRRWHISLSNWFRDIVFYPLERRRLKFFGQPFNIMVVFLLTGLWHGLTLNFVIWGAIHGFALVFESTSLGRKLRNAWLPIQHIYALLVILVGWVFFRSPTPHFAFVFFRRLLGDTRGLEPLPFDVTSPLPFIEPSYLMALIVAVFLSLPLGEWFKRIKPGISIMRFSEGIYGQIASDVVMMIFLLASIAVMADSGFVPAIYGNF